MAAAPIDRRRALTLLGGIGIVTLGSACSSSSSSSSSSSATSSSATSSPDTSGASSATAPASSSATSAGGGAASPVACVLTPEQTEGPYYLDLGRVRADITEDRDGSPLALAVTVVDAATCAPISDAAVDVWHCDADGVYSGFEAGVGETFLRGTQVTDRLGVAEFETIYPGWYSGRAVHIHVKVHTGDAVVHTGQLYFDEALDGEVYTQGAYADRGEPDTANDADAIFPQGGSATLMTPTGDPAGYVAAVTLGVRRA